MDLDLEIALVIGFLILSLGIHEAAHAWVAWLRGDDTAKSMGRMPLNPIPHIDPFMTLILPGVLFFTTGFAFGGAKPVPVSYHRQRKPARDMMLVALAGPLSNILIAVLLLVAVKGLVYSGGMTIGQFAPQVLVYSVQFNLLLAVFNMIPVPPLDGSRVLAYLLPSSLRPSFQALDRYSMLLICVLIFSGVLGRPISLGIAYSYSFIDQLTGGVW